MSGIQRVIDDPNGDMRDAARYRWLRAQCWEVAELAVVRQPKQAVRLGYDLPRLDRLDAQIDHAMREEQGR